METGQIRKEVVASLAAVHEGSGAAGLSMFGPIAEETEFSEVVSELLEIEESELKSVVAERLKSFVAQEDFAGLAEIHPAWLVEVLSKETPRVIGIILRYLPSKQVRYIIEHLPKRIKHRLPQLIDSFAVPAPILNIIKKRFERQFLSIRGPKEIEEADFSTISYLKNDDLVVLFKDIGIHELAMALKGVDRRSLNILLNRLSFEEARALQQRIRSLTDVSPVLLREAKYTVLEMSLMEADPKDLLMDIGLNAFARAVTEENGSMFHLMKQKLEPRLSYTLKRYIDEHIDSNREETAHRRKDLIHKRVVALSKAGSIDQSIARYFISSERTQAIPLPSTGESKDMGETIISDKPQTWQSTQGVLSS